MYDNDARLAVLALEQVGTDHYVMPTSAASPADHPPQGQPFTDNSQTLIWLAGYPLGYEPSTPEEVEELVAAVLALPEAKAAGYTSFTVTP